MNLLTAPPQPKNRSSYIVTCWLDTTSWETHEVNWIGYDICSMYDDPLEDITWYLENELRDEVTKKGLCKLVVKLDFHYEKDDHYGEVDLIIHSEILSYSTCSDWRELRRVWSYIRKYSDGMCK